ncbi:MAG: Hpt domain-containing protein [Desulfobulbus sp.]|jgi:HPt (histidine-containing phosphotransfer) domain-containing protein
MEKDAYLQRIHTHLKTAYLLDEEKIETMMPVFIATLRAHMNRLVELAENDNQEQLAKASHAVKGALLNIGLTDLAKTAQSIENHCNGGTPPKRCQALIAELKYVITLLADDW